MKSILELDNIEARAHFLKQESYFNFNLPQYFVFENLLKEISNLLSNKSLKDFYATYDNNGKIKKHFPSEFEGVNYKILSNKDGKYAWRPFQLIHPVLYVELVHIITEKGNWSQIISRFKEFQANSRLRCYSLPAISETGQSDQASMVNKWWQELEQQSIELGLSYDYILHTDIADCYGSIYTHSIPWAIHTKPVAKERRKDRSLVGNCIDSLLQGMSYGQTNGIPQGSVIMDFIAEIVLGYADEELSGKIEQEGMEDYEIIRYRDDFRIFSNNPEDAEHISKLLTETLAKLGLRLNPNKTVISNKVISHSIKKDKIHYLSRKNGAKALQKHLLIIHKLSEEYPNSGSLVKALTDFYKRIKNLKKINTSVKAMISILVDIMLTSPRTYPNGSAILSKLVSFIENTEETRSIIEKIQAKFDKIPNTGHMLVWLQRLTLKFDRGRDYDEPLCKRVSDSSVQIWDSSWLDGDMKTLIEEVSIIDNVFIQEMDVVISNKEFELFKSDYDVSGTKEE